MSDGDTITAALFNNEFNQLLNAFSYASSGTTGHQHDGGAGEGGNIEIIGDQDFLNKIVVDGTNNRWGFFVEVSSAAVEQIRIQDGAIVPVTDNDIDLGTSSLEFKDGYFDGTVYADAINFNGTAISATAAELNIMDGVTATASELNILDGVTATAAELNILDGVTSTAAELNILDGVTSTAAELNILDGVTATATELNYSDTGSSVGTVVASKVVTADANKDVASFRNITLTGELDAGSLDVSGDADIDGTLEADAITVDGTALNEYIADTVGAMVSSNTETGITVSYQDGDNTLDFALGAAQTTITSLLATDIKIGEDDETKIDFETADTINFYAGNEKQLILTDGALTPGSNAIVDLGTDALEFKDAYFDGTVEADAISIGGTTITSTAAELNILDGVTATAAELNILDGVTSTAAELNILDGVTATAAELNILDGVTATASELNILDGVTSTAAELNILDGKAFLDEDDMSSNSATGIASQQSIKAYVDTNAGTMSSFQLEDDDGTEVAISNAKEVKFIGSGITTNWTDTDNGTDGDPYDLTFTVDAAQTGITSLLATDIKIGEDDQTKIDFEDADTINFYAGNEKQLILTDGALTPGSNAIVDLGTDALEFKDAYFDGTVEADAISIGGTAITSTAAELNILDGVTSTATELNILDGVTATTAELNYLDISTLGTTEASKAVTADANGVVKFDNGIQEESTVVSSSSNAATINLRDGTVFTHTLSENVTYTFSNPAASGYASTFILKVTQDSSARTITWPGSVDWAGGTAPTISTGSGDVDVFVFHTVDGGTIYYGFTAGQDLT